MIHCRTRQPRFVKGIFSGRSLIAPTISTVVRLMKGTVSKQAGFSVWQKGFYDHVIRNDKDYQSIWNYIQGNPSKWTEDQLYISPFWWVRVWCHPHKKRPSVWTTSFWCGWQDSNLHACALEPKSNESTNSTTSAFGAILPWLPPLVNGNRTSFSSRGKQIKINCTKYYSISLDILFA